MFKFWRVYENSTLTREFFGHIVNGNFKGIGTFDFVSLIEEPT